jgi:two-component system sensor histidine kinase VicK
MDASKFDKNGGKAAPIGCDEKSLSEVFAETTEIIEEREKILNLTLQGFQKMQRTYDTCGDRNLPVSAITVEPVWKAAVEMIRRGVRARCITEITKENLSYCKEISQTAELRHLDNVKGSFSILDGVRCWIHPEIKEGKLPTLIIQSTVKSIVELQQYIFQTLWEKAISAEEKIKEIEQGIEHETIDTLRDPKEMQRLAHELIRSARDEILILFSTANAFHRQEKAGSIELLSSMAKAHGVRASVLSPFDDRIAETARRLGEQSQEKIMVKRIESDMQTRISMLIADGKYALVVELKDDTKNTSIEAMGLATYSNSNATVFSYVSIFESFWHQAEMYERLRMHDEMQRDFLNIAAHELRTPIQPIIGLTGILFERASESNNNNEYQHFLEIIHRNANRLYKLTEGLLDVARIEGRSLQLNKQPFNLGDIVKDAVADVGRFVDFNKVRLVFFCPEKDNDIFVDADRDRIGQVMFNLLTNAIKFTKEGIVLITLKKETTNSEFVSISVRDFGSGIDSEIMPRLFSKFSRKSDKGTGLGLFISKGIIEAHGGKIWAKNNRPGDGGGATFTFNLPLASNKNFS